MTTARGPAPTTELWHAAGRAARDGRKQLVAALALLWSLPVVMVGAFVSRLLAGGLSLATTDLGRPLAYVAGPAEATWWSGDDSGLLAYLLFQGVLLALLWGYYGGRLHRLAIVDLAHGEKEDASVSTAYARRHIRTFAGARLSLWMGALVPLLLVVVLAMTGRMEGVLGGLLFAGVIAVSGALLFIGVLIGAVTWMGGFLIGPIVAAEDGDIFDAVTRVFAYVAGDLPRLCARRARFFGGVLLGSGWRFARTAVILLLGYGALRLGAPERFDHALAILKAGGTPHDAARLGLDLGDHVAALAMVAVLGGFLLYWTSDLVTRIVCARAAVYLVTRHEVDGVDASFLRAPPRAPRTSTAAAAGFVEVGRIGGADAKVRS